MANFSIRIDPELKEKMDSLKHLNWSEIIRKAIRSEIRNETEISKAKAVLLNEKIRKKAPENFNSLEIIRKFREERH
jgi:Arc/MetJ-type ribon-helix-helix transcriptional regulator